MFTYGELFAGIGGFGHGFTQAGMQGRWYVERDPVCRQVLARHWPDATAYEDVTDEEDDTRRESVDLISGGFPCQDLSVAGRRTGLAGERSGLWFAFHRILERDRPCWVVIENVPGLLSSNRGRDFATVIRGLVELGYSVAWRVFDSQYFGLAQRRKRVFIVGYLGDGRAAQVLFEPTGSGRHLAPRRQARQDVAPTLAARTHGGGGLDTDAECDGAVIPFDTTQITSAMNRSNPQQGDPCHPLQAGAHAPAIAHALTTRSGQRMESSDTYIPFAFTERTRSDGRNVETLDDLAYALTNPGSGGRTHSRQVGTPAGARRLTPRECERLQGFPDDWTAGHSDSARYRMLGNAVSTNVARWIGMRIMALENYL